MLKMQSKRVRVLAAAGVLLAVWVGTMRLGQSFDAAAAATDFFVLDVRGDQVLGLLLPDRALILRDLTGEHDLDARALSAVFLSSGEIAYVTDDLALRRLNPATGAAAELLPPSSANAPLFLSPDGASLAYLKPRDFASSEDGVVFPLSNGIAVLDLASGLERTLLEVPDVTVNLYGWIGDRLLVQIPTWDPVTLTLPKVLQLAALDVNFVGQAPTPVAELPALALNTRYPQTSFDQRYLAYETEGGVVVAALGTENITFSVYGGVKEPQWTENGLTVAQGGARMSLEWSETEVDQPAPAVGPLAWPPAAMEVGGGASAEAAQALLFYRPVTANTNVSAYMDLNTSPGAIHDWTGWTGSGWAYGHAYDQHQGIDYDGITGNLVNAPAVGTVNRVIIYCCNTYPNGPSSFGTSVRLYHGMLEGLHYWTLVGHLLPDGVQLAEGQTVTSLPTLLAFMGNTGWSTGDHTHLQVYRSQVNNINSAFTIDPYDWGLISDTPPLVPPTPTPTPTEPPRTTGDITGVVRDANNQPAPGAAVKMVLAGQIFVTTTGPDGSYAFVNVPPGSASVSAVRGPRWGSLAGSVQAAQVLGGDITLSQCVGQPVSAEACPALLHDHAQFVADVTYDDGTVVGSGEVVVKTWRLRNIGNGAWGPGYQLVFVSGNKEVNTPAAVNVPATAVNAQADVSVSMTAAGATGVHRGYWRLRSPQGVFFGPTIWVELITQPGGQGLTGSGQGLAWDEAPQKAGQSPSAVAAATCVVSAPATSSGDSFVVTWAGTPNGSPIVSYDVQFLDSSRGAWRDWLRAFPAAQPASATFTGQGGHAYGFRCRATDQVPSTGAYPGTANATTLVREVSGNPDLRIASLQARPAPGGGLLVTVVVENIGSANTQRGFFVDLYRNDVPNGQHDYAGIVNAWVSEPLGAGASVTLNFALTEPSGGATLYAQADTGNLVPESNEGNNTHTSGVGGCVMTEDAYEYDDVASAAKALPVGGSQARNFGGPSEQDWVTLSVVPGRLYRLETSGLGGAVDTRFSLYDAGGTQLLTTSDDPNATSLAAKMLFAPRGAGSYLLRVDNWNPATGGCGATYTLSLTDLGVALVHYLPLARK